MKVVIQRVRHASVTIDNEVFNKIEKGFMLLVGITDGDNEEIVDKMANKVVDLRIFDDPDGKMNLGIEEVGGSILSISQFTLYADCKKGRRPSFIAAARPEVSKPLYEKFNDVLAKRVEVKPGIFGAEMLIDLVNDGPITIVLDSKEIL
ncbi:D-aminoacyl-tRNA deacylase [Anaerorhabdus sp.]|uniref:D-aminoacyl-tRNA deacylase n=1 Tax=Anaerorhabdus sp. TaxID=1872524 RepID=UPI002FCAEB2A